MNLVAAEQVQCDSASSRFTVAATVFDLNVPGLHNVENALAAIAACRTVGVPWPILSRPARTPGVSRRFRVLGESHGITVVDDFPQPRQDNARPTCGRAGAGGLPTPRVWSVAFPAQSWRNLRCGIILRGSSLMLRPSMRRHRHPGYLQRRSGGGPPRRGCIAAFARTREAWWIWSREARPESMLIGRPRPESHGAGKRDSGESRGLTARFENKKKKAADDTD